MNASRIVVGLGGRLGNQMFQYAAGKALATRLDAALSLEGYGQDSAKKSRVQILESFGLKVEFTAVRSRRMDKLRIKLARMGWPVHLRGLPIYVEPHFHFDPSFETVQGGRYLVGGWQSPRYFEEIRDRLLDDFSFKRDMSERAAKTWRAISESPCSVAVHVRRGDYVENPRILSRHGMCGRDYYEAAMNMIRGEQADCTFFVFSDDVERVESEFSGMKDLIFVRGNSQEEDLHLMSSCRHNIIANSTYSWWAAWLNQHPDKWVIAPRRWFGPELMAKINTKDLFPADWRQI
jgi:hypothetical protein